MNRFLIQATTIIIGLLMFTGCSEGPDRDIEYKLFVTHSSLEMIQGEEVQITASPTTQTFTWTSSNSDVATVSSTGLVRAVGDGACLIHVVSSEGLSRAIPVDVEKLITLDGIEVFNMQNLRPVTSLSLSLGQTVAWMEAKASPENYNEKIPFNVIWKSSAPNIISVDEQTGAVTSLDFGDAVITVSVVDKPSAKAEIPASTVVIPITDIQVPVTTLNLFQYEVATVTPVRIPTSYSVPDASLKWESSNTSVVTAIDGNIEGIGAGTATVTVSLNSNPSIAKTISVTVSGAPGTTTTLDFSTFSPKSFYAGDESFNDFVYKKVEFEKGCVVEIAGMTAERIQRIYNYDFFVYNKAKNILVFTGEDGEWDVYYSQKYNYIWVSRDNDLRPAANWIMGANMASAREWHDDFSLHNYSGQRMNPKNRCYMKKIGDNVYQAHILLSNPSFVIMIIRGWELVSGDWDSKVSAAGLDIIGGPLTKPSNNEMGPAGGFVHGYYRITYNANIQQLLLEKVGD